MENSPDSGKLPAEAVRPFLDRWESVLEESGPEGGLFLLKGLESLSDEERQRWWTGKRVRFVELFYGEGRLSRSQSYARRGMLMIGGLLHERGLVDLDRPGGPRDTQSNRKVTTILEQMARVTYVDEDVIEDVYRHLRDLRLVDVRRTVNMLKRESKNADA